MRYIRLCTYINICWSLTMKLKYHKIKVVWRAVRIEKLRLLLGHLNWKYFFLLFKNCCPIITVSGLYFDQQCNTNWLNCSLKFIVNTSQSIKDIFNYSEWRWCYFYQRSNLKTAFGPQLVKNRHGKMDREPIKRRGPNLYSQTPRSGVYRSISQVISQCN